MVRLLVFLALLALAAFGLSWIAANPGDVALTLGGVQYDVSLMVGLVIVLGLAIVIAFAWAILRFVFRIPSLVSLAAKARRREKGYAALSGGMVAVGSGDARAASRLAAEARKHLGDEPLTKLLRAQAAQLAGDRAAAAAAFRDMLEHAPTHALGLRGLHIEARRSGDHERALEYAQRAHQHAALPWAAQAVLDDRARHGDWAGALAIVESNASAKLIDKPTAARWRAVLKTALAQAAADRDPKSALALAQEALALAPGLIPAAALSGRLLGANGDLRRAGKTIEAAWRRMPHPDLASVYLRLRRGDSAPDRLARAKALGAPRAARCGKRADHRSRRARSARSRRRARGDRFARRRRGDRRAADRARLPADGRHRDRRRRGRRGARMARPRRARAARQGLDRRRDHQRPLGARRALGRARRLRLAHAGRTPQRAGARARRPRRRRSTCRPPAPARAGFAAAHSRRRRQCGRRRRRPLRRLPRARRLRDPPPSLSCCRPPRPDDPGPVSEGETRSGFRLFARE